MGRRRDELADLGRDFDMMAERIEGLLGAQRRLLGDISHELGSPLARLGVALELAEQTADEPTQKYLDRIAREAARLDMLIGQLLTLTRLEGARGSGIPGQSESVELARLVEEVCADADFEAQSGRRVQIIQSQPCRIEGNAELLRSAVENVVRNAMLHAPESTQIEVSLELVDESAGASSANDSTQNASSTKRSARIRVRDHGPGVPPDALSELFRPFYRVAEARDRQSGGVGLGLSITERAVSFHGGTVGAQNAADGGLIVEIRLPLGAR
jgi:two-component system sensor histidine kinase CpxA